MKSLLLPILLYRVAQENCEKRTVNEMAHLRSHLGMDTRTQAQNMGTNESRDPSMHPRLQQWKSLSWSWSIIVFAVNYWDSMWFHSNGVYISVRNQSIISSFFGKWPRPKANAEGLSAESSTRWVVWSHCRSIVGYGWIIRWPRLYATKSRISRGLPWPHPVATCLISRISKLQMLRTCKRWRVWQISWQLMGSYFVGRKVRAFVSHAK